MKTFEQKWTAWLDGQLTGKELIEFEASLPDKSSAKLEKRDAKKLGAVLKRELGAHVMANEEFFNHQLRERIARENVEPFREQAAEVSTWWTIRRLFWTGTASLAPVRHRFYRAVNEHSAGITRGRDGLEWTRHRGKCRATGIDPAGIDPDRAASEGTF